MATTEYVVFTPALGQAVTVSPRVSRIAVYANSPKPIKLVAKFEGGTSDFEQVDLESSGALYTYKTSFSCSDFPEHISILANGVQLPGKILFAHGWSRDHDREFSTELVLEEGESLKSQKLDWLDINGWEGWAWYRSRETWIEASFTPLSKLLPNTPTHSLLLRPKTPKIDPKSVLAVFPASAWSFYPSQCRACWRGTWCLHPCPASQEVWQDRFIRWCKTYRSQWRAECNSRSN
jgi:hypothetical protein